MTMDGMPNAHTNTQTISLTQNDDARKRREKNVERKWKNKREYQIDTKRQKLERSHMKRAKKKAKSESRRMRRRTARRVSAPLSSTCKAEEVCAFAGPRFCRHRIISNLFHHFTIYDTQILRRLRAPSTHTAHSTHLSLNSTLSFCFIGMDINRYQKWKLNKYFPSSYTNVMRMDMRYERWCSGCWSFVCTILPPICLLHDTLAFDLNIVVTLDKW